MGSAAAVAVLCGTQEDRDYIVQELNSAERGLKAWAKVPSKSSEKGGKPVVYVSAESETALLRLADDAHILSMISSKELPPISSGKEMWPLPKAQGALVPVRDAPRPVHLSWLETTTAVTNAIYSICGFDLDDAVEVQSLPEPFTEHEVRTALLPVRDYFNFISIIIYWLVPPSLFAVVLWAVGETGSSVVDSPYVPWYAFFLLVWSVALPSWLEYGGWTTRATDTIDSCFNKGQREAQRANPHYQAYSHRRSPVTGATEKYCPLWRRAFGFAVSALVTAFMVLCAFCVGMCSLNLQGYIHGPNSTLAEGLEAHFVCADCPHSSPFYIPQLAHFAEPGHIFDPKSDSVIPWSMLPVLSHTIVIQFMNLTYRDIAAWLTKLENWPLMVQYQKSLVFKRFLFEALDCYSVLFYVGLYELDIMKLRGELVSLYYVDTFRRFAIETLIPFIHSYRTFGSAKVPPATSADEQLHRAEELDEHEVFDDYLEVVITFGYVTVFGATSMPLCSLVSLIAMVIERYSDELKLGLTRHCGPMYRPSHPLDPSLHRLWCQIVEFMCWAAVFTNCILFGFASDQMPEVFPQFFRGDTVLAGYGRFVVASVFGVEHLILTVQLVLVSTLPKMPIWVKHDLEREDLRSKGTAFPGHSEHPAPFQDQDHALDHDVDPGDSGRHSVPSSHLKALVSGAPQTGEAVHSRPLLQEGGADNGGEVDSHPHGEGDGEHRIEAGEHKPVDGVGAKAHDHKHENEDDDGDYDDGDYDDYDEDGPDYDDMDHMLSPAAVQQSSFAIDSGSTDSIGKAGRMCATGDLGHTMMEGLVAFGVGIGVFATACGGIALYIKSKVEEEQHRHFLASSGRAMARMSAVYDGQRGDGGYSSKQESKNTRGITSERYQNNGRLSHDPTDDDKESEGPVVGDDQARSSSLMVLNTLIGLLKADQAISILTSHGAHASVVAIGKVHDARAVLRYVLYIRYLTKIAVYILIASILFIFSIFAVEIIGRMEVFNGDVMVQDHFGSVSRAMLTLFQVMTLDSWAAIARPMQAKAPVTVTVFFVAVILCVVMVLMNLITAVIVENAFSIAKADAEEQAKIREREKQNDMNSLAQLFNDLDADGSGELSFDEFQEAVLYNTTVQNKLKVLDLEPSEMEELWTILDVSGDGSLSVEEFSNGLRRVKSAIQSKDLMENVKRVSVLMKKIKTARGKLGLVQTKIADLGKRVSGTHAVVGRVINKVNRCTEIIEACPRWNELLPLRVKRSSEESAEDAESSIPDPGTQD
ncbi:hypothetical protein Pmar_PMAR019517 [Perkinsus marinus ATCC 50983]|uniref:EF-hand domain-containing protein n=1 Tax=Perkinsus marinus (strain ATCC 50983 / TXsc) TaxID=423536 RepID=C5KR87_PERM5|nr:hypothetical protein Pmar_PMAR019517 [Perkinsus marinus ATCC 50983]EER12988.1 hypothetical protein Pmar_PMAR019517 [Perkinsus marinus ATCC 50983]|eukprot:XP_002781193.1 hypothetical protein Pmar_PMAR019517 [Perkinsus marinus ATCC 50983]